MKNIFLLCAIVCLGQLYGMEPQQSYMEELAVEIKFMVIQALHNTSNPKISAEDNLENTINAIKIMSEVNSQFNAIVNSLYGNQKNFTVLMHLLADKFNTNAITAAKTFKTPIAKEYVNLVDKLEEAADHLQLEKVEELIQEGADVNGSQILHLVMTHNEGIAMADGRGKRNFENMYSMLKLLLKYGANPHAKTAYGLVTTLDRIEEFKQYYTIAEREQLTTLLKDAMKNYKQ